MANISKSTRIDGGISLEDILGVFQGANDPSSGAGEDAPVGSLFLRTNGQVWQKVGAAATAWTHLVATATGVVNINDLGDVTVTTPQNGHVLRYVGGQWVNQDSFFNYQTVYDDLRIPVTATTQQGSNGPIFVRAFDDGAGSQGVFAYAFAPGQEQEVYFTAQLPHRYKEGTDLFAHVHWIPQNANAGDVVWGLEYTWTNVGEQYPVNTTVAEAISAAPTVARQQTVSPIVTLDGTGKLLSSMIMGRLFRNGPSVNDTYTGFAVLLEIDFHFQIDSDGSRQPFIK